jgi:hypothetical protein
MEIQLQYIKILTKEKAKCLFAKFLTHGMAFV